MTLKKDIIKNSPTAKYILIYVKCLTIKFVNKKITKVIKIKVLTYSNGIIKKTLDFLIQYHNTTKKLFQGA